MKERIISIITSNKFISSVIIIGFVLFCIALWKSNQSRDWIGGLDRFWETFFAIVAAFIANLLFQKYQHYLKYRDKTPYITFSADYTQVFKMSYKVETMEYSVGDSDWKELGTDNITFGGTKGDLRLRGKSKIGTLSAEMKEKKVVHNASTVSFATQAEVVCTGDIRTLIDWEDYENTDTSKAEFRILFMGCKQLVAAPDLKIIHLANSCYSGMFSGCTSLVSAPELPATVLAEECYRGMFSGCTSLVNAPDLDANVLERNCYENMFKGCTSLVSVPKLPATVLADECCLGMFRDCTSLVNVPDLDANVLERNCYENMFKGCTSLVKAPDLWARKLEDACCRGMFEDCTSLVELPPYIFRAEILEEYCYENMFKGCTSLTELPELRAKELKLCCYKSMFEGCTSLVRVFRYKLQVRNLANFCYEEMFKDCTSLVEAPELPATTLRPGCYAGMFKGCRSLVEAPELKATKLAYSCYEGMFKDCTSLVEAPELKAEELIMACYLEMFSGCSSLNSITMLATSVLLDYNEHSFMIGGSSKDTSVLNWLDGVSSLGTFYKNKDAKLAVGEVVPGGWSVKNKVEHNL